MKVFSKKEQSKICYTIEYNNTMERDTVQCNRIKKEKKKQNKKKRLQNIK